jgi:outer membrane receptor protein involved in Fe transport
LINEGADFYLSRIDSLVNKGTGRNYGIELTVEKFLSKNYYFLITTSIFDSKYKGSDKKERNTVYNGNYVVNALAGYEHTINERSSLQFNIKLVTAGGRRIIPLNVEQTILKEEEVYYYNQAYESQIPAYFRLDGRVSYLRHSKKITQEWAIDLTNITDNHNEFDRYYDSLSGKIKTRYQQGFLLVGLYRVNF